MGQTEETYKYDEYIIIDASWGQFVEGERDKTIAIVRGRDASSGFHDDPRPHEK